MITKRLRLILCEQSANGYMPAYGSVEIHAGKVTDFKVPDAHAATWMEVSEALRIELALKAEINKPVPLPPIVRAETSGHVCFNCGWHEFHQPQGRSTMIECNRCGAQCEGGAVANG